MAIRHRGVESLKNIHLFREYLEYCKVVVSAIHGVITQNFNLYEVEKMKFDFSYRILFVR